MRATLKRFWFQAEQRHLGVIAKMLFRLIIHGGTGPILLSSDEIDVIRREKREQRKRSPQKVEREDMVSIGIFACNRYDFLKTTCESLAKFLAQYGSEFRHEIILFHDGPNAEIETWARENPLFDRVLFNAVNHGLSKNINAFWFEESKGKYILNIEDDWRCEFKDNFVRTAREILESDEDVGCVRIGRRQPDDYRVWNKASKIDGRPISEAERKTSSGKGYRLLETFGYDNSCALYRFSSLTLTGRMKDEGIPRRAQESEYMKRYNAYWFGARGARFEDSPFLHIGAGKSAPEWDVR